MWGAQINDRQCKSLICEESENDTFRIPWSKKPIMDFLRPYQKFPHGDVSSLRGLIFVCFELLYGTRTSPSCVAGLRRVVEMTLRIHPIALGFDQCYVVQSEGIIAIDAGAPGKGRKFEKGLEKAGIKPEDVKLILITHGHWDHIGSAREMRELTGSAIAMHDCDTPWLEEALKPLSPGITPWGRLFTSVIKRVMPLINIPATEVDLRLGDEDFPLYEYGIPGSVIHTPGHTYGSMSVLLDSGEVFVGDLAMNKFPLRLAPGLPIFAVDESKVSDSWRLLLARGARTVYPAHGKPFSAEIMRKALSKTKT